MRLLVSLVFLLCTTVSYGQVTGSADAASSKDTLTKVATTTPNTPQVKPIVDVTAMKTKAVMTATKDSLRKAKEQADKEYFSNEPQIDNKDLYGKWQMESTEMADGFYYTYSFLRGNSFVFGNDENEGLNRIISLTGTYYLKKDTLIIYVKQENDLVGGTPQMSDKSAGSGWEIKGGKIVLNDLPIVKKYDLPISRCADKDGKKCIEINSMNYYKFE